MVLVEEAEHIVLSQTRDFGIEKVSFEKCLGRVLAEDILADRDLPPFDRVTMDGIAIAYSSYQKGQRTFLKKATQAAGEPVIPDIGSDQCVEIMTGAALPPDTDTVVPYEKLVIFQDRFTLVGHSISRFQHIHRRGSDVLQDEVLGKSGQLITPTWVTLAATVGKTSLQVKRLPSILIVSTGNELVDIHETPNPFQIRQSNNYTLAAFLKSYGIIPDQIHLPDDPLRTEAALQNAIRNYEVILISGGVSMGKFDYVPAALEKLSITCLFHKVQQKPGKPMWFGVHGNGTLVFALPGNPVSSLLCFHRYVIPWLKRCLQLQIENPVAVLSEEVIFEPGLQYFLPVKLRRDGEAILRAFPMAGNSSGDFVNLLRTDAFMELPLGKKVFRAGERFPVWPFQQNLW